MPAMNKPLAIKRLTKSFSNSMQNSHAVNMVSKAEVGLRPTSATCKLIKLLPAKNLHYS